MNIAAANDAETVAGELLAARERGRLQALEGRIGRGLVAFVEVGEALLEIRDRRLYRVAYPSFEEYCRERWGFRRAHAHRLVQSAKVIRALSPAGDSPTSERQARELTPLLTDPEQLREAWVDARERAEQSGSPLTASRVRDAVALRLQPERAAIEHLIGTDRWETPADLFEVLDREFAFELDVCALPGTAKCGRYYNPEQDGLSQPWHGSCWMNPPYDRTIAAWIEKACRSSHEGATVVALLPVHTETGWWWNYCRHAEIRFLRGRLHFSNAPTSAPFASAIVVFGHPAQVIWWEWKHAEPGPLAGPLASSPTHRNPAPEAGWPTVGDATLPPLRLPVSAGGRR
jgi:phage N-6-adenine-methyltransferase